MTRWKKDATEFETSVRSNQNKDGGSSQTCIIPKPIIEFLNEPDRIKFKIVGRKIEIKAA